MTPVKQKTNRHKRLSQGFGLLEGIIVLVILGVLVAITLPAYQDYIIRAKIAKGLSVAEAAKIAVSEYYFSTGQWPAGNKDAGLMAEESMTNRWIKEIKVGENGIILILYSTLGNQEKVHGNTLALAPITHAGSLEWVCGHAKAPDGTNPAKAATTIANPYLPSICREKKKDPGG